MGKNYIGFFCGTGYVIKDVVEDNEVTQRGDASLAKIDAEVNQSKTTIFAYDGCQIHGGGLFAHGVAEQAQAFVEALKNDLVNLQDGEIVQVNLVAHSRGCLSAMLAIKMIQADPELRARVNITVDLRDPVPGNFQASTKLSSNLFIANQTYDLSDCDVVKKAYLTLQEEPIGPLAFDALVPRFHPATAVEIETLPGMHDIQQRDTALAVVKDKTTGKSQGLEAYLSEVHGKERGKTYFEYHVKKDTPYLELGNAKSLAILLHDGHSLKKETTRSLLRNQLQAYTSLVQQANVRDGKFKIRDLHFGGHLIANNAQKGAIDVVNWRHAQLNQQYGGETFRPGHVLFGMSQPHYNHRKTDNEHYCDLTMTLDNYLKKNPQQQEFVDELINESQKYLQGKQELKEYRENCEQILKDNSVHNKTIYQAINSMCMNGYFAELQNRIDSIPKDNELYERLLHLKEELMVELHSEIRKGKTLEHIAHSNPLKIAENTVEFLNKIYDENNKLKLDEIVEAADDYANKSIRYGRNWSSGSKAIVGLILGVAAAAVGCAVGAAIGLGIGFSVGAITGPGALVAAISGAFLGGFQGAMIAATATGAAVGIGIGAAGANVFFRPSESEKQVQCVVKNAKEELKKAKIDSSLSDLDDEASSSITSSF